MKPWTTHPGQNRVYLCDPDGFYKAVALDRDDSTNTLQELAQALTRMDALRESHAELAHILSRHHYEAGKPALYLITDLGKNTAHALDRANALETTLPAHSGEPVTQ